MYVVVCKANTLLNKLMTSVMCLHFSMQEEDIVEYTNVNCHFVHFS